MSGPPKPNKPNKPNSKVPLVPSVTARQPLPRPVSVKPSDHVVSSPLKSKPPKPAMSSNPFDDDADADVVVVPTATNGRSGGGDVALTEFVNPAAKGRAKEDGVESLPSEPKKIHQTKNINSKKVINYNYNTKLNKIYDKVNVAEFWILMFVIIQVLQCSTLVHVGRSVLPSGISIVLWILTALIALCCLVGRAVVKNKPYFRWFSEPKTPEDETEVNLKVVTVYLFCLAAILEGVFFAIFSSVVAGNDSALPVSGNGYTNRNTLLETMRFASITLLFLHRIIRPANRLDPARTMLEVSACCTVVCL
jgi:hypothetical protein